MAFMTLEKIGVSYDKKKQILKGLDLAVEKGELVSLLGPSGCGKTTTLRVVAGFIEPGEGTFTLDGNDMTTVPVHKRNFGIVFQSYALFPHLTVYDNVAFGLRTRKMDKSQIDKKVKDILEICGLTELSSRFPKEMSGGQRQRVALARALVIEPKLLLLDEPLSNLDAKLRISMRVEIKRLQKKLGITTLFVTHDQEEAMAISDTIAVMKDGVIQHVGTPKDIYQRPKNVFVATFIGRTNIIPARVENGSIVFGNGYRVEMDCLKQTAGQEVLCSVRPEEFVISPDGTEGISGVVKEYTYLGLNTHYFVETDDGQKTVEIVEESSIEDELKPGQRVLLQVKKHKINVFNKEGSVNLVRSEAFYEG